MEAIPIITAVCTIAKGIGSLLQKYADNARKEKEISEEISETSSTISQIQNILLPLKTIRIDKQVLDSVRSMSVVLKRTEEHVIVCEYMHTHFPSLSNTGQLKRDTQQLNQQLALLSTSLTIAQYTSSLGSKSESKSTVAAGHTRSSAMVLDFVENRDVKNFWRGYVGEKVQFISESEFHSRLSSWLGKTPSPASFARLMLRLDEFGAGGVTPSILDEFAARNSLKGVLKMYMETDRPIPNTPSLSKHEECQVRLPLLIWIDDNPINNATKVAYARKLGINVIQLTSTALAKAWIEEHSDFLRRNDDPSLIRFISDNHRDEHGSNSYLNYAAGENILRYLRGRHYNSPVLIHAGYSISGTQYVTDYQFAGSTVYWRICRRYISFLVVGGTDDFRWMKFMAS